MTELNFLTALDLQIVGPFGFLLFLAGPVKPQDLELDPSRPNGSSSFDMTYNGTGGTAAHEAFRMTGSGMTYDGSGAVIGGTVSSIEFLVDNQVAGTLTGFVPQAAAGFVAALGHSSLGAYQTLVGLLDDDTVITGSKWSETLETGAGNDTATLGAGNDTLVKWKAGDLTLDAGRGIDTLSFQAAEGVAYPTTFMQKMVVNLTTGRGFNPYGGTLQLSSVENVVGTSEADRITGNNKANVIGDGFADGGADVIDARGGNDIVKVLDLDTVRADGGTGFDTLEFLGNIDLQDADFAARITNFEKYAIFNFYILPAGSILRGDAADNWFACDDGNDVLEGRGGNDRLDGGDALNNDFSKGADVAVWEGTRGKYTITAEGGTITVTDLRPGSPDGTDTVVNIETLRFKNVDVSVAALFPSLGEGFFGSSGDDDLGPAFGTTKNCSVYGLAGDDILSGGAGNDLLVGGRGNDTYILSGGRDTIVELAGEGIDTVKIQIFASLGQFSLARYGAIENLINDDFSAYRLVGNKRDNVISSFNGADTIIGGAGKDTLSGGGGSDVLKGGVGNDVLIGGAGFSTFGADILVGGSGKDVFVFTSIADSTADATDIITDFNAARTDRIDLSAIDAIPGGADNAFHFIEGAAFTRLGQVRVFNDGMNTFVEVNSSGGLAADMVIQLEGLIALDRADFIL